jgi:hypothetical protein
MAGKASTISIPSGLCSVQGKEMVRPRENEVSETWMAPRKGDAPYGVTKLET